MCTANFFLVICRKNEPCGMPEVSICHTMLSLKYHDSKAEKAEHTEA